MTTDEKPARRNIKPLTEMVQASKPGKPATASKTAHKREGIPDAAQLKTWHWDVIAHGDCFMRNAEITIFDNGSCHFFGDTSTTDAGDVWLVRGLAFIDAHGLELWRMPQFDGPVMVLADMNYPLYRDDLAFPAYIFPYTTNIIMYHHC